MAGVIMRIRFIRGILVFVIRTPIYGDAVYLYRTIAATHVTTVYVASILKTQNISTNHFNPLLYIWYFMFKQQNQRW